MQPAPAEAGSVHGIATLRGKRALVVDGVAVTREILAEILQRWGLQVETADDLEALLRAEADAAKGAPYGFVLLDARLPNSFSAARAGAARGATVVMLLSAARPEELAH